MKWNNCCSNIVYVVSPLNFKEVSIWVFSLINENDNDYCLLYKLICENKP